VAAQFGCDGWKGHNTILAILYNSFAFRGFGMIEFGLNSENGD
jgi:hypothetical protein